MKALTHRRTALKSASKNVGAAADRVNYGGKQVSVQRGKGDAGAIIIGRHEVESYELQVTNYERREKSHPFRRFDVLIFRRFDVLTF